MKFSPKDIVALRTKFKLTQRQFSKKFGIPLGSIRNWEQGRSSPDGISHNYLMVIKEEPEIVARIIENKKT